LKNNKKNEKKRKKKIRGATPLATMREAGYPHFWATLLTSMGGWTTPMGVVRLGHPWPKKKKIEEAGFGHPQWPKLPSIFLFFFFLSLFGHGWGWFGHTYGGPLLFFLFSFLRFFFVFNILIFFN
jgi:hypothetical protein